jgi:mono/diheme cytochrome c family protein
MRKTITAGLLLLGLFHAAMLGSGPYMPPRAEPTRMEDFVYRMGQAVYSGDLRIGSGQSCSSCHRGGQSLKKDSLRNISAQAGLKTQINKCVTQQDRVNGTIDNSQMQALLRFLTNRYKL